MTLSLKIVILILEGQPYIITSKSETKGQVSLKIKLVRKAKTRRTPSIIKFLTEKKFFEQRVTCVRRKAKKVLRKRNLHNRVVWIKYNHVRYGIDIV